MVTKERDWKERVTMTIDHSVLEKVKILAQKDSRKLSPYVNLVLLRDVKNRGGR